MTPKRLQAASATQVPLAEYETRWSLAQELARDRDLDGIVVWSRGGGTVDGYYDVFYLSGHYTLFPLMPEPQFGGPDQWGGKTHAAVVLPRDGEPTLVVDTSDYRADLIPMADVRFAVDLPRTVGAVVEEKGMGGGRLGFVGRETMVASTYERAVGALGEAELHHVDESFRAIRLVKSARELDLLREACAVGDQIVAAVMEVALKPGAKEADAIAAGYAAGVARGAAMWDMLTASGPFSEYLAYGRLPSWTQRTLEDGDLFHVDCYGIVDGYMYDFARTCVVGGSPSVEQLRVIEPVAEAIEAGVDALGPGVAADGVFHAVRGRLAEGGLVDGDGEPTLGIPVGPYSHGHGLGIGAEEPEIVPDSASRIEAGMCIAIEAMAGKPGIGAAFIEQNLIVNDSGVELISNAPVHYW